MRQLRWMLCGFVMAFTACAVDVPTEDSTAPTEAVQVQTITRTIGPAVTTCTFTQGPCMRGKCEEGELDFFAHATEVCCTDGVCTTERYRVCGC